jgi:histidinol-phosphate aminotransferase
MSATPLQADTQRGALEVARASYRAISLYSPNRTPCRLDLSDNTNMWGPPPAVRWLLGAAADPVITRYPRAYADDLKRAIADYLNVSPACVVTGCGSDDVLDSAIRAFSEPGQTPPIRSAPFQMVEIFARMNGLTPADSSSGRLRRRCGRSSSIAALQSSIHLCSPNNPDGDDAPAWKRRTDSERCAGRGDSDEAYMRSSPTTIA